jgi:hypothetical protein
VSHVTVSLVLGENGKGVTCGGLPNLLCIALSQVLDGRKNVSHVAVSLDWGVKEQRCHMLRVLWCWGKMEKVSHVTVYGILICIALRQVLD